MHIGSSQSGALMTVTLCATRKLQHCNRFSS